MKKLLLLTFLVVACFFAKAQVTIDPQLQTEFAKLNAADEVLEVIIYFKGDGPVTQVQLEQLRMVGIDKGISMRMLPAVFTIVTRAQVEQLRSSDQILSIYWNAPIEWDNRAARDIIGVNRIESDTYLKSLNNNLPFSGKGIVVMVNDSGVDATHPDLQFNPVNANSPVIGNVYGLIGTAASIAGMQSAINPILYLTDVTNTDPFSGHGTHVAGSVIGRGTMSGGKYKGSAVGAQVVGYGTGIPGDPGVGVVPVGGLLGPFTGFDYALYYNSLPENTNRKIRIVTNSWGTSNPAINPNGPTESASKRCFDAGITVLFSAGNRALTNTLNPYAKMPWVINIAAGDSDGNLASFSSRGVKNDSTPFEKDGELFISLNRPTITGPGVNVVSTRGLSVNTTVTTGLTDPNIVEREFLPFYTVKSGTSMSTPHTAGVVALMLEANPDLTPSQIKDILEETATYMPGREDWEVGAGYVNAHAAVYRAIELKEGKTTPTFSRKHNNLGVTFKSTSDRTKINVTREAFNYSYAPVPTGLPATLPYSSQTIRNFTVSPGVSILQYTDTVFTGTVLLGFGLGSDHLRVELRSPSGKIFLLPGFGGNTRTFNVAQPEAGQWTATIRLQNGNTSQGFARAAILQLRLPDQAFTGLPDISGHPRENSIKFAVLNQLADALNGGYFPDEFLTRKDIARNLLTALPVGQYSSPTNMFTDAGENKTLYEALSTSGNLFKDKSHTVSGLVLTKTPSVFNPEGLVTKMEMAYTLVQSSALEGAVSAAIGQPVMVNGKLVTDLQGLSDLEKAYVKVAIDNDLIEVKENGGTATFEPESTVTRGDYAAYITRSFAQIRSVVTSTNDKSGKNGSYFTKLLVNEDKSTLEMGIAVSKSNQMKVEIVDISGRILSSSLHTIGAGNNEINIPITDIANGMSVIKVSLGNEVLVRKFIK